MHGQHRADCGESATITEPQASAGAQPNHGFVQGCADNGQLGVVEVGNPHGIGRCVVTGPHRGGALPQPGPAGYLARLRAGLAQSLAGADARRWGVVGRLRYRHVHRESFDQHPSAFHRFANVRIGQRRE